MASAEELSESIVREYFVKNGGKVKRDDLFNHFRGQLDKFDEQGTSKNRFRDIVNSLASLQNVEGEKYFVLKKGKNGTTPVLLRRPKRQLTQRKDKGVSLPASMRNFRFSQAEDPFGNVAFGDNKPRSSAVARARAGLRSESADVGVRRNSGFRSESANVGIRRNNSDTSIIENNAQANDSGVDTGVSSLLSESPSGSQQNSFSRSSEYDQMSLNSGDTGIFNDDDHYEHDVPSHVLTPFEKSWMMSAISGNKSEIVCQLEEDPSIISFKDFLMGYTALHWAAKQGNEELVRLLVDGGANVNMKSNGGFTALHLATMCGKLNIVNILIDDYHANVHIRDHSGKEPKDHVAKNLPEQTKKKLTEKLAERDSLDTINHSGFSRYLEPKDTPKIKPKLKAGSSFRFLRKPKKSKRGSDRPVIEHWDSARQERLESTLKNDEKELYKMERSNSGSLFPNFFYNPKTSQPEPPEEKPDSVDSSRSQDPNSEDVEEKQQQRLLSRSYPENEFRDFTRISESDPQKSINDRRSPSGSLSNSSNNLVNQDGKVSTSDNANVFKGKRWKRRSFSENNLKQHFQDELATKLTMDQPTRTEERPSVFAEGGTSLKTAEGDEQLMFKIDFGKKAEHFSGGELETLMTVGNNKDKSRKMNGNVPGVSDKPTKVITVADDDRKAKTASILSGKSKEPFVTYNDEYSTTLSWTNELDEGLKRKEKVPIEPPQIAQQDDHTPQETRPVHNDIPKFNNNYKQVSEILTTEEDKKIGEEPTNPVRPPRKKDKKVKNSHRVKKDTPKKTNLDFESGNKHVLNNTTPSFKGLTSDFDDNKVSPQPDVLEYKDSQLKSPSSNSLNDNRVQCRQFNADYLNFKGAVDDVSQGLPEHYPNQKHTRRKTDGFAVHRAGSDGNLLEQSSKFHPRTKSEGFSRSDHDRTAYNEPVKPSADYTRRKSDGYTDLTVSMRSPEQLKFVAIADQQRSKSFSSQRFPESITDQQRSNSFSDQQRSGGFAHEKEVSLDHPRRRTIANLPPERSARSEELINQRATEIDQHRSESLSDQRKYEGYTTQKEVSLDHPGRRTIANLPTDGSKVLPEVSLDSSRRRSSPGYQTTDELRDDLGRVLPPYRPPPPGLLKDTSPVDGQRNRQHPTRPNYKPPPVPTNIDRPRKSHEFPPEYLNPNSRSAYFSSNGNSPQSLQRTSDRSYHSSEDLPKSARSVYQPPTKYSPSPPINPSPTADPVPPPRKHRGSRPSVDLDSPPSEIFPIAPPRKSRGRTKSQSGPTTNRPFPCSNELPPRSKFQESYEYREVPVDTDVNVASNYYQPDRFQSSSSDYRKSDPNSYYQSEQSGNYWQADPNQCYSSKQSNGYLQPDYGEYYPSEQTSTDHQSDNNDYYPSDSQSSNYQRSEPNKYSLELPSNYRQSDFNEHYSSVPGNFQSPPGSFLQSKTNKYYPLEHSSDNRRSDPNQYYQSKPGNAQQSNNYQRSEPNEYYPSEQSSDYYHPAEPTLHWPKFCSNTEPSGARDQAPDYDSPSLGRRSAASTTHGHLPADEIDHAKSILSEPEPYLNYHKEFRENADYTPMRSSPDYMDEEIRYENEYKTAPIHNDGSIDRNVLGFKSEQNMEMELEPEFIVAKQMTLHEGTTEGRPLARGSREDVNSGALAVEMKNKWFSTSSDGSSENSESRNKYRVTSMI